LRRIGFFSDHHENFLPYGVFRRELPTIPQSFSGVPSVFFFYFLEMKLGPVHVPRRKEFQRSLLRFFSNLKKNFFPTGNPEDPLFFRINLDRLLLGSPPPTIRMG